MPDLGIVFRRHVLPADGCRGIIYSAHAPVVEYTTEAARRKIITGTGLPLSLLPLLQIGLDRHKPPQPGELMWA